MEHRILILKTGEFPVQVRERHGPYERSVLALFPEENRFVVIDARKELPPGPDWLGIIITGSESSTYDGDTWIRKSEDFLRRAADRGVPTFGICFGHQLLAQTFGGKVEKCPWGWELGTVSVLLTPEAQDDPLFSGLPNELPVQQSHGDVVGKLPSGAVCLARSSHCPIQAFRLGENIWGTQFHPEFTQAIMKDAVHYLTAALPPDVFPRPPANRSLKDWIVSGLRETAEAQSCLQNFVKQVRDREAQKIHPLL